MKAMVIHMKKTIFPFILIVSIIFISIGCANKSASKSKEIAVFVPTTDSGWITSTIEYANKKAKELNNTKAFSVTVHTAANANEQKEQIDELLADKKKVSGIVILPFDNSLEESVKNISKANIPFVMYDRIIENPELQSAAAVNVKGDNEGIGAKVAERFIKDGLKPGDGVYVMVASNASVAQLRTKGFVDTLKSGGWSDDDIASIVYTPELKMNRWEASKQFTEWLNNMSAEELAKQHFVYAHDDEIVLGVLDSLAGSDIDTDRKAAFITSVKAIGSVSGLNEVLTILKGEHSNEALMKVMEGFDFFTATYDPAMIQTAIQDMADYLDGKQPAKEHIIDADVIDSTNAADFKGFS